MNENVFRIHPSLRPIVLGYVCAGMIAGLGFVSIIALPFAFAAFLALGIAHLNRQFTIHTLTGNSVRIRSGILGKAEEMVPLEKIQNIKSRYTIWQRILGIGDITLESAGEKSGTLYLKNINSPQKYADKILEASQKNRNNSATP